MGDIPEFTTRPELAGTFGMVASTHWLASAAGMAVLERGGKAFDAGVAAALVLQVGEAHPHGPGGEVPVHPSHGRAGALRLGGPGPAARGRHARGVRRPRARPGARQRAARRLRTGGV